MPTNEKLSPLDRQPSLANSVWEFTSFPDGEETTVRRNGSALTSTTGRSQTAVSRWTLHEASDRLALQWYGPCAGDPDENHLLAALEALFSFALHAREIELSGPVPSTFLHAGIVVRTALGRPIAERESVLQLPRLWHGGRNVPSVLKYVTTDGLRHPLRPPKPGGIVYQRNIPHLGQRFLLYAVAGQRELEILSRKTASITASGQKIATELSQHRASVEDASTDRSTTSLVGLFNGVPFGYIEAYWVKESHLGPHCGADDYDRGWRIAIDDATLLGGPLFVTWLTSISHHLFLDDCRTQRIFFEQRSLLFPELHALDGLGYVPIDICSPDQPLQILSVTREHFFAHWASLSSPDGRPSRSTKFFAAHHIEGTA